MKILERLSRLRELRLDAKFIVPRAMNLVGGANQAMTAIRATGNYKYRQQVPLTDDQLREFSLKSEAAIRSSAIRTAIAEALIKRAGYWALYEKLQKEVDERMLEGLKEEQRKAVMQQKVALEAQADAQSKRN